MFVAQALQHSIVEELERLGFDPLKEYDSAFDFEPLMGHIDPYGTLRPSPRVYSQEKGNNENDSVNSTGC
jgi:hypothetical protein